MTSNPYFVPGPQRAEKVKSLFDTVASRYDLLNDLLSFGLHRRWKKRLARMAKVGPACRALDLCCGTGDVTFTLAMEGAAVVGLDFSPRMLETARTRTERRRQHCHGTFHGHVAYVQGDALRLPFSDETFDAVTISYGLRNLASVESGLREMIRVAKPGGRILVLDFGKPNSVLLRRCYGFFLRRVVPVLGKLSSGGTEAYAYISTSLDHYPAQRGVAETMERFKLENISVINLLLGTMSIHCARKPVTCPVPGTDQTSAQKAM